MKISEDVMLGRVRARAPDTRIAPERQEVKTAALHPGGDLGSSG